MNIEINSKAIDLLKKNEAFEEIIPLAIGHTWMGIVKLRGNDRYRRLDIFWSDYETLGAALLQYTGDLPYTRNLRYKAKGLNYKLGKVNCLISLA